MKINDLLNIKSNYSNDEKKIILSFYFFIDVKYYIFLNMRKLLQINI